VKATTGNEPAARLLAAVDDVATAFRDLAAGTELSLACDGVVRRVTLCESIPAGHKFAVRDLSAGLRICKYGEAIGRLTTDVRAGAWVHEHNLATHARLDAHDARIWREQVETHTHLEPLGDVRTAVGESPVWDDASGRLYWIDVRDTPAIHMIDAAGATRSWSLPEDAGSIVLAGAGRLLVALRSGFAFFDIASGVFTPIVDPESDRPQTRMNDGKCDAGGRFWCGSTNPESGIAEGSLYVLDARLRCRRTLGDLITPNGLAWSPDGTTMYLADTRRAMIHAFAFDPDRGTLGDRRTFADTSALPGGPDGATVDREGFLWSAHWDGGCLIRYAPDGDTDRVVRLPVSRPTSCAFGGPDHRRLYVTTATRGLSQAQRRDEPLAGGILVLDVGLAGLPPVSFAQA
jgi:sugar lactone lactonase YvrE